MFHWAQRWWQVALWRSFPTREFLEFCLVFWDVRDWIGGLLALKQLLAGWGNYLRHLLEWERGNAYCPSLSLSLQVKQTYWLPFYILPFQVLLHPGLQQLIIALKNTFISRSIIYKIEWVSKIKHDKSITSKGWEFFLKQHWISTITCYCRNWCYVIQCWNPQLGDIKSSPP